VDKYTFIGTRNNKLAWFSGKAKSYSSFEKAGKVAKKMKDPNITVSAVPVNILKHMIQIFNKGGK